MIFTTKYITTFAIILITFASVSAQQVVKETNYSQLLHKAKHEIQADLDDITYNLNTGRLKGKKVSYLDPGWQFGLLLTRQGNVRFFSGRYNLNLDAVELRMGEERKAINPNKINAILLGNRILMPLEYESEGSPRKGYFEVLYEGDLSLLQRHHLVYERVGSNPLVTSMGGATRFSVEETLFYKENGNPAQILSRGKRGLKKCMHDKEEAITQFIDEKNINVRDLDELNTVFEFYNQL